MPRWLSSFLIVVGFLAIVALALLPKNVTVIVDVDSQTEIHHETTVNHNGPVPINGPREGATEPDAQ